jgi:hypothetical protein
MVQVLGPVFQGDRQEREDMGASSSLDWTGSGPKGKDIKKQARKSQV